MTRSETERMLKELQTAINEAVITANLDRVFWQRLERISIDLRILREDISNG